MLSNSVTAIPDLDIQIAIYIPFALFCSLNYPAIGEMTEHIGVFSKIRREKIDKQTISLLDILYREIVTKQDGKTQKLRDKN